MARPSSRKMEGHPAYMTDAVEHLVSASSPGEAFGALSALLRGWLSCQLIVLQVRVAASEPLLLQSGGAITLPGIGVGWRSGDSPEASALAKGEIVVHDDLDQAFTFGEDANLARAGFRSAVRGSLFAGDREVGRFGLFAEAPGHFGPDHVQILREITPALVWVCRQSAFAAEATTETAMARLLEDGIGEASHGLPAVLRACRNHLSRTLPAAGILVMLDAPSARPAVLVDRVGVSVPGTPQTDDPVAWRSWLQELPPEGHLDSVAWLFPACRGQTPVGAVAIAFPQEHEDPDRWFTRLRPLLRFLVLLAEQEERARQAGEAARNQLGALAAGLADEIGNLMTQLALQVDLLRREMAGEAATHHRTDALARLVKKGTSLSARLGQMAASQRSPDRWEPLGDVVTRAVRHLRSYRGGEHLAVQMALGDLVSEGVESGRAEHALTQLFLRMAQNRSSEVRTVLRGRISPTRPQTLLLRLSEEHQEPTDWENAPEAPPPHNQTDRSKGVTPEGARTLTLEIPVRLSS